MIIRRTTRKVKITTFTFTYSRVFKLILMPSEFILPKLFEPIVVILKPEIHYD